MLRRTSRSASRTALRTASASMGPRSSVSWRRDTSSRLAQEALAPELTPSATTTRGEVPPSALCQSSLTAWDFPREDATGVSSRIPAVANTASRTKADPSLRALSCRGAWRSPALTTFMPVQTPCVADRESCGPGYRQRARRRLPGAAAEQERLPELPSELRTWPVRDSVDGHAIVAVDDDLRTRLVQRDDFEMAPRDVGVRPVDDESLIARATDTKRKRARRNLNRGSARCHAGGNGQCALASACWRDRRYGRWW